MFEKFGGSVTMDGIRNEELRKKARLAREFSSRVDQRVLRWFGHVERMDEYRIARWVLMAEGSGVIVWVRSGLG